MPELLEKDRASEGERDRIIKYSFGEAALESGVLLVEQRRCHAEQAAFLKF